MTTETGMSEKHAKAPFVWPDDDAEMWPDLDSDAIAAEPDVEIVAQTEERLPEWLKDDAFKAEDVAIVSAQEGDDER